MILSPYSINESKIKLKKKIQYLKKNIYPVKYNNSHLIIQTPIIFLPWGLNQYNSLDLSLQNDISTPQDKHQKLDLFTKMIRNIENHFKKMYIFRKCTFKSSVKINVNFPDVLRVSCDLQNTLIFNEQKQIISKQFLKEKSFIMCILHIPYVWKTNTIYGVKWMISQIKVYTDMIYKPIEYSFIDSDTDVDYENDPNYQKYFKMLKIGLPKEAVIHKMNLDNVDPSILTTEKKKEVKPKNININPKNINILNQIKSNTIKLKKTKVNNKVKKIEDNKFIIKPNDLQNAITKLKKINIV